MPTTHTQPYKYYAQFAWKDLCSQIMEAKDNINIALNG